MSRNRFERMGLLALAALVFGGAQAATLTEGFDAVAARPSVASGPGSNCPQDPAFVTAGWRVINASAAAGSSDFGGTRCVTQGFADSTFFNASDGFNAQAGTQHAYAGFPFTAAGSGTPSLWLVTPRLDFGSGATLEFWTRRTALPTRIDRLQVRAMLGDGPPVVGATADEVGDFTTLLLDINPSGSQGGLSCPGGGYENPPGGSITFYPQDWCRVRLTVAGGMPQAGSGYLAFRYYSPFGQIANGYFAAIDTFSFNSGLIQAPAFAYGVPPNSIVSATGGTVVGSSAAIAIPVTIGTAGGGGGVGATTSLQCVPPPAPFAGFDQDVIATGADAQPTGSLSGTCVRGSSDAIHLLHCLETRGNAAAIAVDFTLRCPSGIPLETYERLARVVREDDPAAYWRLGETEGVMANSANGPSSLGSIADLVVTEIAARGASAVPPTGTVVDGAMAFCSSCSGNAYTDTFDIQPSPATGITIETWLQIDGAPANATNLIGDRNVNALLQSFAFLYLMPDRRLRMHLVSHVGPGEFDHVLNTVDSVVQLEPGARHHVVASWDEVDRVIRVYLNGVAITTSVVTGSNPTVGGALLFGPHRLVFGSDGATLTGTSFRLDEAALYLRALPAARVARHYEVGSLLVDGFEY